MRRRPICGALLLLAVCAALSAAGPLPGDRQQAPPGGAPAPADAALAPFHAALADYMALRTKISSELPPLRVTPSAAEINAASDALARAVQRGRGNARQGVFFPPPVAAAIRRQLELALRSTDRAAILALINEEPNTIRRPTVHLRFPSGRVLATSPAVLLHALPALPKELEYRFIGRTLVLRDVDAALILDYLSPALPPS